MEDNPVRECPVGNLKQTKQETTYRGRKQPALRWIATLAGEQVLVKKGHNEEIVWTVIPESYPENERSNDVATDATGLKNIYSIMQKASSNIILA